MPASTPLRLVARFELPGVPPSPNELRSRSDEIRNTIYWRELTWTLAQSARNSARWPLPVKTQPPAPRWVAFTLYRHGALDRDHVPTSITPCLNGLKGVLIWDDGPAWVRLYRVRQHVIPHAERLRTEIEVHLVRPADAGEEE